MIIVSQRNYHQYQRQLSHSIGNYRASAIPVEPPEILKGILGHAIASPKVLEPTLQVLIPGFSVRLTVA